MSASTTTPSGEVAFVFTDIEGSTKLQAEIGDAYPEVLTLHHKALRRVWNHHRGYEVDGVGDSFFIVFSDVDAALRAAVAAQRALAETTWPHGGRLLVRMGIHVGFARAREGRYVSLAVHQGSRIMDASNGGHILISGAAREALKNPSVELEDLGLFQVRDFPEPEPLYRVVADGWEMDSRPPRVRPAVSHNLIDYGRELLGREREMAELRGTVAPGTLTTLVGPGGIGKSALATEFGLRNSSAWADGFWMVPLIPHDSADAIAREIVSTTGARTVANRPILQDAIEHLRDKDAVLYLDHCEHVLGEAIEIVQALRAECPRLAILTSSQLPLAIGDEQVLRVGPLATEAPTMGEAPAVQLFRTIVGPGCAATTDEIHALCELVEGSPFAIELAAASARVIPVPVILDQLGSSMELPSSTDRNRPPGRRSMQPLVEWTLGLLDDRSRQTLEHLSILRGAFTFGEANAACSTEPLGGLDTSVLWDLMERSLLTSKTGTGGTSFQMSSSVREAALGQLAVAARQRAAAALGRYFTETFPVDRSVHAHWTRSFASSLTNIRGVIPELTEIEPTVAQRLAWSVIAYYNHTGAPTSGVSAGRHYLDLLPQETVERVGMLAEYTTCCERAELVDECLAGIEAGSALEEKVGAPEEPPTRWDVMRGCLLVREGNLPEALGVAQRAFDGTVSDHGKALAANLMGLVHIRLGDMKAARNASRRALDAAKRANMDYAFSLLNGNLAEIEYDLGNPGAAAAYQLDALETGRALGHRPGVALSLIMGGRMAAVSDRWPDAVALSEAGKKLLLEIGHGVFGEDRKLLDQLLADAKKHLPDDTYRQAEAQGREWTLNEACEACEAVLEATTSADSLPIAH